MVINSYSKILVRAVLLLLLIYPLNVLGYQLNVPQSENQTLNWGELQENFQSLNPLIQGTYEEQNIRKLIFGKGLFEYDPYRGRIIPGLVENWAAFSDSLSWIITIRENIRFHDNSILTTDDIKFSIELYLEHVRTNGIQNNLQSGLIREIKIIGNNHFQLYLNKKIADLGPLLSEIPVLSRNYYSAETLSDALVNVGTKTPFGSGPFIFGSLTGTNSLHLFRHEQYVETVPAIEHIQIIFYESATMMMSDFITGKLDFMQVHSFDHARELNRAGSNFGLIAEPVKTPMMVFLNFNTSDDTLRRTNMRKAIIQACNRDLYPRSGPYFSVRSPAYGPLPENSPYYFRSRNRVEFSPRRALETLRLEGWRDSNRDGILEKLGNNLSFELLFPENDKYFEDLVRYIKLNLGTIGIELREQPVPYQDLRERVRRNEFQITLDYSFYYPNDPVRTFSELFDIEGTAIRRNKLGQRNQEALRQFRRASIASNPMQVKAIFERLQDLFYQSETALYIIYQHHRYLAVNKQNVDGAIQGAAIQSPAYWILRK